MLAFQREEQLSRARGFFVCHAGHGFVKQKQLGVLHQQHADLQPLFLAMAQIAGQSGHAVGEVDGVQHIGQAVALGRIKAKHHR